MSSKAVVSLTTGLEDPEKVSLADNASLGGTVPLGEWIGDEPAITFSY